MANENGANINWANANWGECDSPLRDAENILCANVGANRIRPLINELDNNPKQ